MSWRRNARAAHRDGSTPSDGATLAAARALVFATTSTGLAATGHHLASGRPMSWPMVWLAFGLLFLLALPFARRPRSLGAVMSATGATQALLHFWLGRTAGGAGPVAHGPHSHGAPEGHEVWPTGHHGASMTAAHIAAALLVAWSLRRADAACSAVAESLGDAIIDFLVRLLPPSPPVASPRALRPDKSRARSISPNSPAPTHALWRRGPPAEPALAI